MKSYIFKLGVIIPVTVVVIITFYMMVFRTKPVATGPQMIVLIKDISWNVELAQTLPERVKGLSGRDSLAKNSGMLFVFPQPAREVFWMKGMSFSLDIIWISEGKIVEITKNAQPLNDISNPVSYKPKAPVDMVLEINAGQVDQYGIKIGDTVNTILKT